MEELIAKLSGTSKLAPAAILARLLLSFILAVTIALIYSRNYKGYGRPSQMALVLVLVGLATSGIIMAIGDNIALSLGLVGALSIVRFRAAVKDNRDLAYLFWIITIGLVCGSGRFLLALMLMLFMGVVVVLLERFELFQTATRRFIVILTQQRAEGAEPPGVASLLPGEATLKSTVFHRESGSEESTYLVDFPDAEALEGFKTSARAHSGLSGFQILGPEDTIIG